MVRVDELISTRKDVEVPLEELDAHLKIIIQRGLDEGDHDLADRLILIQALLAVRELADLRKLTTTEEYLRWKRDRFIADQRNTFQP